MPKKVTKSTDTKKAAPRARKSRATSNAPVPTPLDQSSTQVQTMTAAAISGRATITPTEDQIRAKAYEIFRRGLNPSDPVADWFQAEQELRDSATL